MIHSSAIVHEDAVIDPSASVGPLAVVEADVRIGAGCRVHASAMIRGGTTLGADNEVHPYAILGGPPQDRRHDGGRSELVVGDGNVFREHVTVHGGTSHGGRVTRVGDRGLFMVGTHIAHDSEVGNDATLANNTLLGGHVVLGERVTTGGGVAIAPFCRVGRLAFLAGGAMVEKSVPPFVIAAGDRAKVRALNVVGLERAGVSPTQRKALRRAFRSLFRRGAILREAAEALAHDSDPLVRELIAACLRTTR